jgi:hypothetical protein
LARKRLTQRRSSLCRPTRENTRGDATGITPDPPGHSVGGTAHITLQSRIVAGCVCRVIRLVIGLDPGKGPCCSRLTCLITRGIGSAPLKTIYYAEHPGKSGTLRRHTLFEDRPTSLLAKGPNYRYAGISTPHAGLYRASSPDSSVPVRRDFSPASHRPAGLQSTGPDAPPRCYLHVGVPGEYRNTPGTCQGVERKFYAPDSTGYPRKLFPGRFLLEKPRCIFGYPSPWGNSPADSSAPSIGIVAGSVPAAGNPPAPPGPGTTPSPGER